MPLRISRLSVNILPLLLRTSFCQIANFTETVAFYYTRTKDYCAWGNADPVEFSNITGNGGVCAFVEARNRFYECPAPRDYCWTWSQNCKAGTLKPGTDQKLCGSLDTQWCCQDYEECTTLSNKLNMCVAPFSCPLDDVSIESANSRLSSIDPGASTRTDIPIGSPSTLDYTATLRFTASTILQSGSSTSMESLLASNTGGSSTGQDNTQPESKGLSTGALAGIVVGLVAAIVVTAIVTVLIMRKRRPETPAHNAVVPERNAELDGKGPAIMELEVAAIEVEAKTIPHELDVQVHSSEIGIWSPRDP